MAFFVPPAQAVIHKVSIRSIIIFIISLTAYSFHGGIINQNHFFMIIITQCTNHIFFISYATGTEPSLPVLDPHRAGTIYISMGMMDTLQRYMMNQLSFFVLKKIQNLTA